MKTFIVIRDIKKKWPIGKNAKTVTKRQCNYCNDIYCSQYCFGAAKAKLDYRKSYINNIKSFSDGLILSDLHIRKDGGFSWNLKYLEFAEFISKGFQDYDPWIKQQKNGMWTGRTHCHPDIKKERKRWYPNGVKIVPKDVSIDRESLLGLYLGDGSLHKTRGWIGIYTLNFTKDDNEYLCDRIKSIGLDCRVKQANKMYMLYFSRPNAENLISFLGESPVSCYGYKFRIPDREIYNKYQRELRRRNCSI